MRRYAGGAAAVPGAAGYISSKAAVIAFAQAVATEYKNDGIRCNAILPSVIDTPGNRAVDAEGRLRQVGQAGPDRRRDRRLLSDDSSPTSGAAIPVYGRA